MSAAGAAHASSIMHFGLRGETMTLERIIRLIAGSFILASLALAHWVNINWLWFTAFVGANLFQSSLTGWCLMEDILVKLGVGKK
jgi:hypothetical protein